MKLSTKSCDRLINNKKTLCSLKNIWSEKFVKWGISFPISLHYVRNFKPHDCVQTPCVHSLLKIMPKRLIKADIVSTTFLLITATRYVCTYYLETEMCTYKFKKVYLCIRSSSLSFTSIATRRTKYEKIVFLNQTTFILGTPVDTFSFGVISLTDTHVYLQSWNVYSLSNWENWYDIYMQDCIL